MPRIMDEAPIYEKVIFENDLKGFQYRLVVSEFRGEQYLHVRKYFLSYEGDYIPSSEGASMVASIENTRALLEGMLDIVSAEEGKDEVQKYLYEQYSRLDSKSKML
jgi:hypothetical protein